MSVEPRKSAVRFSACTHQRQHTVVGRTGLATPVGVLTLGRHEPTEGVRVRRKDAGCWTGLQEKGVW